MTTEKLYPSPLVWLGTWRTPGGLLIDGFHVWDVMGKWVGVYRSCTRAKAEARVSDAKVA